MVVLLHIRSLHAFMDSYTLVKADGGVLKVTRDEDPHLFSAMAPSIGVFGVVIEAEMRLVPLQNLEARFQTIPFVDLLTNNFFR